MRVWLIIIGLLASIPHGSSLWAETPALTFYVSSSTGNDHNSGTFNKPFLTIERARDAIRELKTRSALGATAVTVYLRGGIYPLKRTFALSEQDSGISGAPIIYAAYQNEVHFDGKELATQRTLQINGIFFRLEIYPEVRDFFRKVQASDEQQTVLREAPGAKDLRPLPGYFARATR